jgi:predicted AlkP superfamily pyrophosphatase or phosphodiesterase
VPALLDGRADPPPWLPEAAAGASQVVLLALDGLGWDQLLERQAPGPDARLDERRADLDVAPSTTATALSSLALGCAPGEHGVVGYRINVRGDVLNVLRWQTPAGDARSVIPPNDFQARPAFLGRRPPVVTRAEFADRLHRRATWQASGSTATGWSSTLVTEVRNLLRGGEPFVYAYYDGVDKVAHEYGLADHYDAELVEADRLVADLASCCRRGRRSW